MRQSIIVIALLFGVASLASIKSRIQVTQAASDTHKKYQEHCAKHGRSHKDKADFDARVAKFKATDDEIEAHNKDASKHGWAKGHNKFSDMHEDEK